MLTVLPLSGYRTLLELTPGITLTSLEEATLCLDADSESKPINPTITFAPDTPEIFCSVKPSTARENTEVLAGWVYLEDELAEVTDYVIDTSTVTTEGARYLSFSLLIPDAGRLKGDCELVMYINGREKTSLPFTVTDTATFEPAGPARPDATSPETLASPTLAELTIAQDVAADHTPVGSTTSFEADTVTVYTTMLVNDAPDGILVRAERYDMRPSAPELLMVS